MKNIGKIDEKIILLLDCEKLLNEEEFSFRPALTKICQTKSGAQNDKNTKAGHRSAAK